MNTEYKNTHVALKVTSSFETFTHSFEASLGRLNVSALQQAGHNTEETESAIKAMQGEEGMTLFNVEDLGALISLNNPEKKAKRYFVGNYLRASQIISMDIRLGLYAPLRVLVYEGEDKTTYVEYELPSSQFSRFNNELITKSGLALDQKLSNLIAIADDRTVSEEQKSKQPNL